MIKVNFSFAEKELRATQIHCKHDLLKDFFFFFQDPCKLDLQKPTGFELKPELLPEHILCTVELAADWLVLRNKPIRCYRAMQICSEYAENNKPSVWFLCSSDHHGTLVFGDIF